MAKAEEERITEELRKVEEEKAKEEQNRKEEEERLRQPKPTAKKAQKKQSNSAEAASVVPEPSAGTPEALESEIRAMMAKMRELNSKDPALLARIWEEERRAKAPKSPTVPNSSAQAVVPQPAQAVKASTANSKKKTVPKEPVNANAAKPATPIPAQVGPAQAQTQAQAQAGPNRSVGSTIWPAEKKAYLANAAATYLNERNPDRRLESSHILDLLNTNPSYIELCEQLEQMGITLDRAAFAKNLLQAAPDINSASRRSAPQPTPVAVQRAHVPAAVLKKEVAASVAGSPQHTPAPASSANGGSYPSTYPPFTDANPSIATAVPVAEMVPIKAELKAPANKEEAARKRNLSELVDLTLLSEEEDMGLPVKKQNTNTMSSFGTPHPYDQDIMVVDKEPMINNFPIANMPSQPPRAPVPSTAQPSMNELRHRVYVGQLDKKKALRRNSYNPATIARDVLLACGRHPSQRQLNQHLDILRTTLPQVSFDSDLSTLNWDLIDPGNPPPGYFKDSIQGLTEDADDEEDSDEEDKQARLRASSNAIGGQGGAEARAQALPEPSNPFKQKRVGRPPRHSFPNSTSPTTPKRPTSSAGMSVSAPRPSSPAAGVGYSAFRSATEYGPDGQPLPKKRGRPVGWRKAIHGSSTAQARPSPNGHTGPVTQHQPSQPSSVRNVRFNGDEPIPINSRSSSVAARPQYQLYQCKWQECKADLHNLETLKKHVFKVHRKATHHNTLECLWEKCGKDAIHLPRTNMTIGEHIPHSFDLESDWRNHIQQNHIRPLSWELGDGPASGLSGNEDN
ncbi:hypothetical protein N0V83_007048 [Neocucurbitaria cava]|uniref:C2H2-type domain-containing protein n=1 Tax=Neocucurbitaria cava TaxID=798079 RepID=A0A9W8Y5K5_9PLEO|nr:hypothetical protein N0V83_007048 [Neocucurbitaria cava]